MRYYLGALIALVSVWFFPFRYIESGHAGLTWQPIEGRVELLHAGWHAIGPMTYLTEIDIRPQRVCLTSSAHAAANCRLVQFNQDHYQDFIAVEGWRWFWWSNRFSFNLSYGETYRGFRDVLRGYAFSAQQYDFIIVLEQ